MSDASTNLSLALAVGADNARDYIKTGLRAALVALDALFNASTGHDHNGAGKGAPVGAVASGMTIASPTFTGTITLPTVDPPAANALTKGSLVKGHARVTITAGTPALDGDYNVSGLTDNGVGDVSVLWDRDFADAVYAAVATPIADDANAYFAKVRTNAAGSTRVQLFTAAGAATDTPGFSVIAVGTQ